LDNKKNILIAALHEDPSEDTWEDILTARKEALEWQVISEILDARQKGQEAVIELKRKLSLKVQTDEKSKAKQKRSQDVSLIYSIPHFVRLLFNLKQEDKLPT
jgi:hypothetical protein